MKLLITGGGGYVGAMLADQFAGRSDVDSIMIIDKQPIPDLLVNYQQKNKIIYIEENLTSYKWQEDVKQFSPDIIIHTAWEIRQQYGKSSDENVKGSSNIFDIAFELSGVKKLIHFSTVASYGAFAGNEPDRFFTEADPFRKTSYTYAEEKRIAEEVLKEKFQVKKNSANEGSGSVPQVFIIRPVSITGPRGRFMRTKFGLQSALSGKLSKSLWDKVVTKLLYFTLVTSKWLRQFVHEDDISNIVELLAFNNVKGEFEIFNACPPGPVVTGEDMAKAVNKKAINLPPWFIRIGFFFAWHISRGKIPTSRGVADAYSYPIPVDGLKITRHAGFQYLFSPTEAFTKLEGRYAKYVNSV
jgi:nucleoside-diphosphate-sugar epimerase